MKKIINKLYTKILLPLFFLRSIERNIEFNRILLAQILIRLAKQNEDKITKLSDSEFRVFSQWGEDGIIQYLLSQIPIQNEIFVEFGVENYTESNTRFLLINNNWKGLIIDGNTKFIKNIKTSELYWRYELTAINSFITKENINYTISSAGIKGDIGLLSIDIDGNDYWVWQAIDVISPRIVICEYNSVFGSNEAVTIPYIENFNRTKAHHTNLYFGASLKALCILADEKGYVFVGSNSAGCNAFFVKREFCSNVPSLDYKTGYVKSKNREPFKDGNQIKYVSGDDRIKLIENMKVFNVENNKEIFIKEMV